MQHHIKHEHCASPEHTGSAAEGDPMVDVSHGNQHSGFLVCFMHVARATMLPLSYSR